MTDNTNIQILEALGYWDKEPFSDEDQVFRFLLFSNAVRKRQIGDTYRPSQLESAAQYAIKNRLNMEG